MSDQPGYCPDHGAFDGVACVKCHAMLPSNLVAHGAGEVPCDSMIPQAMHVCTGARAHRLHCRHDPTKAVTLSSDCGHCEIERMKYDLVFEAGLKKAFMERSDELRAALELIASPMRPDGTFNRDREACRQLAEKALRGADEPTCQHEWMTFRPGIENMEPLHKCSKCGESRETI